MSVYSVTGKGWRYDFTQKGIRHTEAWFKTKKEALRAEAIKKEELRNPQAIPERSIDMGFLELVNLRLDHIKAYNSERHYKEYLYMARRWMTKWSKLSCKEVTMDKIQSFMLQRKKISAFAANKDIRYLRATFNFGIKKKLTDRNPAKEIDFFPEGKRVKYIPPSADIDQVIEMADPDTQDYLWAVRETMARISEINQLTWDDVDLKSRQVTLYTRKKKGGHLTPRHIPMTERLYQVMARRFACRDQTKKWVFWHRYYSSKTGELQVGPYQDRKKLMTNLCKKSGVRYFRYHALRHSGASIMENNNVSIGTIQRVLGHENRTTTEIYLHNIGNAERNALDVYERAREESLTQSLTQLKKGNAPD